MASKVTWLRSLRHVTHESAVLKISVSLKEVLKSIATRQVAHHVPFGMATSLLSFLSTVRKAVLNPSNHTSTSLTVVLGNTSCDLDSFISAATLAYFYTLRAQRQGQHREHLYVPVLNLSRVPSSELWRLRPEFGTALGFATMGSEATDNVSFNEKRETTRKLLSNLITIADLTESLTSPLYPTFIKEEGRNKNSSSEAQQRRDVILVDHNAPSLAGFSSDELMPRFNIVGCIDHHVDELSVPSETSPRIVKTGIGSCASLVVTHLRDANIWPPASKQVGAEQLEVAEVAKLALAPILIDTFNLKASGDKCSETDRKAVKFLESHFDASTWDRNAFFTAISNEKSNSLDLLTMPEIFERDYKEWTENSESSSQQVTIGIPSLVRSISWLVKKAGSADNFVNALYHFARETDHKLDMVVLMTKSSGPNGEFRKELGVAALGKMDASALEKFEQNMSESLKLEDWQDDEVLLKAMEKRFAGDGSYKIWWQGDTQKGRKQVAPAVREAARV